MTPDMRFVASQAARLAHCRYFPAADRAPYLAEIEKALRRGKSEVVVMAVIDEWLEEQTDRPSPADIYKAIAKHNGMVESEVIDLGTRKEPTPEEVAEFAKWAVDFMAKLKNKQHMKQVT